MEGSFFQPAKMWAYNRHMTQISELTQPKTHKPTKKKDTKKAKTTAADIIFCQTKQLKWFLSSPFCVKTRFVGLVPQTII